MRRIAIVAVLAFAMPLLAQEGHAHASTFGAREFWSLLTGTALFMLTFAYVLGLRGLRAHGGAVRRWEIGAFFAGIATVVFALLSKFDRVSDILFSAHMTQHEILMLLSAPLLVAGRPFVVALWAFPAKTRGRIGHALREPSVRESWRWLTRPFFVLVLHAAALWVWHIPAWFEAALRNESIHAVQHLSFFATAALFWWALIHGRYGRSGYGVGVLYVFATAMHSQILGALLTFAPRTFYPTHALRTGARALEDQQLAGIVMWVPFGVVFVVIGLALFAAWLGEAERRVALTSADALPRGESNA